MSCRRIAAILFFSCLLAGCPPIAVDNMISLKGEIIDSNGRPLDNCILELHVVGEELPSWYIWNVDNKFLVSTTCAPYCHEYFIVIKDQKSDLKYQSKEFKYCRYQEEPVDFGAITLKE